LSKLADIIGQLTENEPEENVVEEKKPTPLLKGLPEKSVERPNDPEVEAQILNPSSLRVQLNQFNEARSFFKSMKLRGHITDEDYIKFLEQAAKHIQSQMGN